MKIKRKITYHAPVKRASRIIMGLLIGIVGCNNEDVEYSFSTSVNNQSSYSLRLNQRVVEGDCVFKDPQDASKSIIVEPHQKIDISFRYFCTSSAGNEGYLSYEMEAQYKYFTLSFPEESFKNSVEEGTHIKWRGDKTGPHELNLRSENFALQIGEEPTIDRKIVVNFGQNTFSILSPSDTTVELLVPDSLIDSEKLSFPLTKEDSYTVLKLNAQVFKSPVRGSASQSGKKLLCTDSKGCSLE